MLRKPFLAPALLGLTWLCAATLRAEPLACEPGSRRYLSIVFYHRGTEFGILPPPSRAESRAAILICRDRRLLETDVANRRETGADHLRILARVTRGRLTPMSWDELTAAARAIRIGFMTD